MKITHEEFQKRVNQKNSKVTLIGTYNGMDKRIQTHCNVCGYEWMPFASNLVRGHGCPKCQPQAKMKQELFVKKVSRSSPNTEVLSKYDGSFSYIECQCKVCGNHWSTMAFVLLGGSGCPICGKPKPKSQDQFVKDVKKKHPNIIVKGEYKNSHTPVHCVCDVCNYSWFPIPNNLMSGEGCPKCGIKKQHLAQTKTLENFKTEMKELNPEITIIGTYINTHTGIKTKCNLCGHIWSPYPKDLINGNGCPNCSTTGTSYAEQIILESLKRVFGKEKVLSRDTKLIGKELDIVIPDLNIAIEPGSWHWHKDKIKSDKEKQDLCKKANIRLIQIYDSYKRLSSDYVIIDKDTWLFKCDLGKENSNKTLKEIVYRILSICNIQKIFSDKEWNEIKNKAYKKSRKRTTSDFEEMLSKINPDIQVLGKYTGALNHIDCKCKICGHKWNTTTPAKLLSGTGCPECAKKKNKRGVIQYDTDMNYIREFESLEEAGQAVGIVSSSIVNACRGRIRTSGGYMWRYKDNQ